jgi:MSHA biogenesis protein MshO
MVGEIAVPRIRQRAKRPRCRGASSGFSLVELIVVIAITGVIASVIGSFIAGPIQGFFDQARRAKLVDAGQLALIRMSRDLRAALPNSVRRNGAAIELLLTLDGDRYRSEGSAPGAVPAATAADTLEFNVADTSFNTFRQLGAGQTLPAGLRLAVYPLGASSGADPYVDPVLTPTSVAVSVAPVPATATIGTAVEYRVAMNPGHAFPHESPNRRVFLVQGPVTYHCDGAHLLRYDGYSVAVGQPAPPILGATVAVVVPDIVQSCSFNYDPGTAQRNAVALLALTLVDPAAPAEVVRLVRQVQINNTP